ncbi:MAG: ABC transporter substrate-binding protein [Isosphaeraceae bacterium]
MNSRAPRRPILAMIPSILIAGCVTTMSGGCHSDSNAPGSVPAVAGPAKVRIGYLGLTCEAAMFVAQEKGFFTEEGLDVEFVKTDWDSLRDGLGLGRFDANYHLIMYLLKPIEQGLDVKITGGIHSGCLRLQVGAKTDFQSVEDLKGKKIGVPTAIGSPPFMFSSRVLKAHGMDPQKDVEWVVLAPEVLGLALDNGQVDAVTNSEPIGSILLAQKKVRTIADSALDMPFRDEFCCATVVSGPFAKRDPASAAKVTRALLKGARWVEENPSAAAQLSVEKTYIAASTEINAHAISHLKFMPGVSQCRESVLFAAREMKAIGLLNPSTDPNELARKAWLDLEGVSDDWIKGLNVEHVAGGGPPPPLDESSLAAILIGGRFSYASCCDGCGSMVNSEICSRKSSPTSGL